MGKKRGRRSGRTRRVGVLREPNGRPSRKTETKDKPTDELIRRRRALGLKHGQETADPVGYLMNIGAITAPQADAADMFRGLRYAVHGRPFGKVGRLGDSSSVMGPGDREPPEERYSRARAAVAGAGQAAFREVWEVVVCQRWPRWLTYWESSTGRANLCAGLDTLT